MRKREIRLPKLPPMGVRLANEAKLRAEQKTQVLAARRARGPRQRGDPQYSVPVYPQPGTVAHPHIDIIFRCMNHQRMTYSALMEKCSIDYGTLRRWKTGRTRPMLDKLLEVYATLGIRFRVWIPGMDN